MSGENATSRPGGSGEGWRTSIASVLEAVRFDRQPVDAVDRLMELIIATDALPGGPESYLAYVREALASGEQIAKLAPQPHPEEALRELLGALERRLDEWIREGPAVTQLEFSAWRPEATSPVVAHLRWEPAFLSRWLGVSFDHVPDQLGDLRVAVLRLTSGRVVALVRVVGNPAPGTSLLQMGAASPQEVVDEFVADSGLSPGLVERVAAQRSAGAVSGSE